MTKKIKWYKALDKNELPEGRVKTVNCEHTSICMTHHNGKISALDNQCPHQKGPLGEGSIENGYLRCPWHGWDFDPVTGKPPGGFDDGVDVFQVEEREDGYYVAVEEEEARTRTVSDIMVETMINWGIVNVFGMVGHSNLGLADALRKFESTSQLKYIGIRHEGAAAFAASAYAKLTGRAAACIGIAGPGSTNLLTGLWDANIDRAPVIALNGQVDTQVLGPGAFQEIDLKAAYGQVAQWSQTVLGTSKHEELMNLACKSAHINRGVSQLIFPDEIQIMEISEDKLAGSPQGRIADIKIRPPENSFNNSVKLLSQAKRPAIIVGHGARYHMNIITELAELLNCPILTTFKGKGLIPDNHPLACGVLGRSGTPIASWFMNEADLLLVMGASLSNHTGITNKKPIIHVDTDPMTLAKFHDVEEMLMGDIGEVTKSFLKNLKDNNSSEDHTNEISERWDIWRKEKAKRREDQQNNGLSSAFIFELLSNQIPQNAIIAVDVGNNTYSFGRYFEAKQQAVLMSGYLGSIGFSFPAAMGAWAATQEEDAQYKNRPVISISGDGGFGQYAMELTTAVKYDMNITHFVLNNSELGKITKEQRAANLDVWQTSLVNPNFAEFANNCGALGIRVNDALELEDAIKRALNHQGPSLVEIISNVELI